MGEKIKGITIEFRGNATPLQKAIREVNSDLNKTTRELSQVNKALKFNPTSVELWRQKQNLLNQKVQETTKKLEMLRDAQKQMDDAGVSEQSEEYRKLQREIIETTSKLKTFKAQYDAIGSAKLQALAAQFKQIGSKATEVGTALTKRVTAPIVGIGAASVKAFNEVQAGLNIVAQKTGTTGKELEEMQTIARDLAKELPTDFESAGTAVGELNTRFGVTGQELETLSEQYIKFAKVNSTDLNTSIDETQKALSAFGLSAKDAPQLLDTLTKAGQLTGASVDTLTQGLIQNATAFQELGLGIDQSVMLMGQMEKSGANSETVMMGLRKALKNAAAEGIPLDQALSELQDTILNGTDSMDGLTAAYDLFGKSGDQIYGAVKNGTLDFNALGQAVADTGGTLDSVFEQTLTPAEKFQTTLNSVKDAGYQIGNTIMTIAAPALEKLAEKAQAISEWWSKLSPETQQMIVKAALVAAAIGPVVAIIGKIISVVGTIMSILPALGAGIAALASPVGIVIAVIAGLVAAGIALYKNWDKVKAAAAAVGNFLKKTWTSVKTAVSSAMSNLKNAVINAWTSIKNAVSNAAKSIYDALTWPFRKTWEVISGIVDKIKSWFPLDIGNIFGNIKLPHFSWEWIDLGGVISIPSINIDWYKKGGIFDSPSVVGVGEAGSEAVVPLDKFWEKMDRIAEGSSNGPITINVYATPGMDEAELARKIEQRLVAMQKQRAVAHGNI